MFSIDVYSPAMALQLVDIDTYNDHLYRSIQTAESQEQNSFHCLTADCPGWCVFEDEVNTFDCPVCEQRNCLQCKAMHAPLNCREYQDRDINRDTQNAIDVSAWMVPRCMSICLYDCIPG